jgi:hypothetical protein|tara:strand:+ start:3836 stop:4471 length:636 start_codon:yes stop_codon:yes gene_type:complete
MLPRAANGSFWLWHLELGWCFMGADVADYIWLSSAGEWIFFINDDPTAAYYYSFAHNRWTAFSEVPAVNLRGFDQFVTDIFNEGVETYQITPNAAGTGGTFSISGTETLGLDTASITFSGTFYFALPSPTSGQASLVFDITNYAIEVRPFRGQKITFNGTAQQFYNSYGQTLPDELEFNLIFDRKSSGSYTAAAKFNSTNLLFEDGSFGLE